MQFPFRFSIPCLVHDAKKAVARKVVQTEKFKGAYAEIQSDWCNKRNNSAYEHANFAHTIIPLPSSSAAFAWPGFLIFTGTGVI